MKLEDLQPEDATFTLMKGDPKTGKSIAAHSYPEPIYTFDLDKRMESVKDFYTRHGRIPEIEFDRFTDFFSIKKKLEELRERCPFKTVNMDSLTSLARKSMQTMIDTRAPDDQSHSAKKEKISRDRGGIRLPIIEDFGGEASAIFTVLNLLTAIHLIHKVNINLTAHIISPEAGAVSPMRCLLTGGKKIAAEIPVSFNEVYHFYVVTSGGIEADAVDIQRKFVVATRSIATDWASTTLNVPDKIDFTGALLWNRIQEEMRKDHSGGF